MGMVLLKRTNKRGVSIRPWMKRRYHGGRCGCSDFCTTAGQIFVRFPNRNGEEWADLCRLSGSFSGEVFNEVLRGRSFGLKTGSSGHHMAFYHVIHNRDEKGQCKERFLSVPLSCYIRLG